MLFFSPKKLARLFLLKETKPSPDRLMMIELLTVSVTMTTKTRSKMTTATTFSRQNDADSPSIEEIPFS